MTYMDFMRDLTGSMLPTPADDTMPTHRHLDDELAILRDLLVRMVELVDEQLAEAINAVSRCDVELGQHVHQRDDEVDALELKVDHQCARILALHTPVAVDLRLIITAVKLNTDLERIGDHAKNLAKHTRHLEGCLDLVDRTPIMEMASMARRILLEAQDAFLKRDRVMARQVLADDRQVDRLYSESIETIVDILKAEPEQAEACAQLIIMSKAIERVADHAKNIAEAIVFLIEGVDIRHRQVQTTEK